MKTNLKLRGAKFILKDEKRLLLAKSDETGKVNVDNR